jgi:predicted membrane protein
VTPRLVIGIFVVALGVLFLMDNADLIQIGNVLRWWPVAIMVLGGTQLLWSHGAVARIVGGVVTSIGAMFLFATLQPGQFSLTQAWGYTWPALLLVTGASLIFRGRTDTDLDDRSRVRGFAFMSGQSIKSSSPDFAGGDLSAIMGGFEIDLRDATIQGSETTLEVFALMGGIELRIPESWALQSDVICLLGGIENATAAPTGAPHTLRVKGLVLMGGMEIKN